MSKPILSISDQIKKMETKKSIVFKNDKEKEEAGKFLEKYNYLNVSSLKYLYATGKDSTTNLHDYNIPVKYSVLKKKYMELLKFENKIRDGVLMYETELKVHFTLFILEFLSKNGIDFENFLDDLHGYSKDKKTGNLTYGNFGMLKLKTSLQNEWENNIGKYSPLHTDWKNDYHLLIKVISFGQLSKWLDLDYLFKGNKVYILFGAFIASKKISYMANYKDFMTIGILRNALCHKESLVTFLEKAGRQYDFEILTNKNAQNYLTNRKEAINFIYRYYHKNVFDKFGIFLFKIIKLKNLREIRGLEGESWIMKFEKYKLKHSKKIPFNKIKIYL